MPGRLAGKTALISGGASGCGIRCNAVCPGFIRTPHGMHDVDALTKLGADASFVNGAHVFVDNFFTAVQQY